MNYQEFHNAIKNKPFTDLSLKELAFVHLNYHRDWLRVKGGTLCSNLSLVIREIRHAKFQTYSRSFLPVAAAFTVLDQIGFCYSRSDIPVFSNSDASPIKKSLYYFCGLGDNDRDTKALYAMRNSFLHTSSLLSKGKWSNQPSYNFVFYRYLNILIQHPLSDWDGDFNTLKLEMTTYINPERLIELTENR
ncbi:MAG: hypothetical protein HLX52_00510 [Idiomarinaceae bacterium]|uniref:hypothetical protein n=1 Tax=Idiomarina sp. 28-8 TaxID=1260624 RepID=UPI00054D20A8|nr:hypothetical protein [Idiomarina sp. 28-8]NWO01429.1 hypothetical protein [Idiomarinaceae bacterium]